MEKFILPNLIIGYQCNEIITNEFKTKICFDGISGSIPFHILNGEYNLNNTNDFYDMPELKTYINNYSHFNAIKFYLYANNIGLKDSDYYDIFSQNIFKMWSSTSNLYQYYIIIEDLKLAKYLAKYFPKVQVIFSIAKEKGFNYSIEELKTCNNICGFKISYLTSNSELEMSLRKNFPNAIFIGTLPLSKCYNCKNYKSCCIIECQNILNFSKHSHFDNCNQRTSIAIEELYNEYLSIKDKYSSIMFEEISMADMNKNYQLIEDFFNYIATEENND